MQNPLFDQPGEGISNRYTWDNGEITGPDPAPFDNIHPPAGWIFWWLENAPGEDPTKLTGRPESGVIRRDAPGADQERFLPEVGTTFKAFTFWRNNRMGLGQSISCQRNDTIQWSIDAHAWYSQCSQKPHDQPLDYDCNTPITSWAHYDIRLGIDPTGGQNPFNAGIVWTSWQKLNYGTFGGRFISYPVYADGPNVTLWLDVRTSHSLKHCDLYVSKAAVTIKQDVTEDCIYPAFPFHRTVHTYRPELGRDRYLEICAHVWDTYGPQTISPSYDELPLGPEDDGGLLSKTGILWDIPWTRHADFINYYREYYPDAHYNLSFDGDMGPPIPAPPGEIFTPHVQTEMDGLQEHVGALSACGNHLGWIKLVKGFESSEWVHALSPSTRVIAREINNPILWEDPHQQAVAILDAVWDAIARNTHIHALESTNELFGTSLTNDQIDYWVSLEIALSNEIKRRSDILQDQGRPEPVIGVLINAPVGNLQHGPQTARLQPIIDTALTNGHGISYHGYFPACQDQDKTMQWIAQEGRHHHLRLQLSWAEALDGLAECLCFCTEFGAIECTVRADGRPGGYLATNGWRSLGWDFSFYLQCLDILRPTLDGSTGLIPFQSCNQFTTGDPNIIGWNGFTIGPAELAALTGALCP